jgi:hypothetical protein
MRAGKSPKRQSLRSLWRTISSKIGRVRDLGFVMCSGLAFFGTVSTVEPGSEFL